jgi:microcystin degradation protein MlrC
MRRIVVAEISHETNVFAAKPTTFADIERAGLKLGMKTLSSASGTNSAFGGFIAGAAIEGFELVPICSVWATPSGMIALETIDRLVSILVDGLEAAIDAGPIDGLLLALHGAMVTERDRDGDALLLEAARHVVGIEVPIVSTLDLHANISQRMVNAADVLIGYDTYPHVDMAERAIEACSVLARLIRGEVAPTAAMIKPPMLPTSQKMPTSGEPMCSLIALAHEWEEQPGVVNVTIAGGFPPADVTEAGLSVLVTTNDDPALALRVANEIAETAWNLREGFLGGVATFDEAALAIAGIAPDDKPLVIVDIGDNPWTGGPGDSAELLRFLLDQSVENAALAIICDPESVGACRLAGPGNWVDLHLGAKSDRSHGEPLEISAFVQSLGDGKYINAGPMMTGVPVDLGPSTVILCGPNAPERGISVLVTSRAETPIDLNIFRSVGIEPASLNLIGLKGKGHFRASFEPIASRVMLVEGPGITGADLTRLPFQHIRRPIWPLDEGVSWP